MRGHYEFGNCRLILSGFIPLAVLAFAAPAQAACSSPAGVAGDQFYNTAYNVMQYCNDTNWVNMGAYGGSGSETDPQVGTLTNTKWCTTDGTDIDCTTNAPLTSYTETDPQVGTLTNTKWCTTDGTDIDCTTNAPLTSESDPKVGAVTSNKWCRGNGTQVVCDQNAPSSASGLVLLNSGAVSNQATLDITLTSGYRAYKIVIQNLVPVTDDTVLWMRTSSNGGSSYDTGGSDYKWVSYYFLTTTIGSETSDILSDTADSEVEIAGEFGNSTNENGSIEIDITNPSGGRAKLFKGTVIKYDNAQYFARDDFSGARLSTSAVNAVRLLMSSGNISAADWALYGYN